MPMMPLYDKKLITVILQFDICKGSPVQDLNLPQLFEKMEELKQHAGVEEYSISQTTLEHVFVQLAQQ